MTAAPLRARRTRLVIILLACLALGALAWIGWQWGRPQAPVTARPALWRATLGASQVYLFGTIHSVPRGDRWLAPKIVDAAARSDRLMLEVTGLADEQQSHTSFETLGRSPNLPPIATRIDARDLPRFREIAEREAATLHNLDRYESWAAALLINAAASADLSLSADDAGEAVLTRLFVAAGKPVRGLETIDGQLGLFDTLGEADQRLLLTQSIRETQDAPAQYRDLHTAWAAGDLVRLERQFLAPLTSAPGLRRVLIQARNRNWGALIDADMRRHGGTMFVAVGAGHLLGPDSVQAQLARRGWHIERIE